VNWPLLLTAALGGGVAAWLLDESVTAIREFETARLLVIAELTMIERALALRGSVRREVNLPTAAWDANKRALVRSIRRRDAGLLPRLMAIYGAVSVASTLGGVGEAELRRVLDDLGQLRIGCFRGVIAYGPAFLWREELRTGV
jgi:hypothetical protein